MAPYKFKKLTPKEIAHFESLFVKYHSFIKPITSAFPQAQHGSDDGSNKGELKRKPLPTRLCPARGSDKKPARTVEELQEKLQRLKGKPILAYKEKLQRKGLKTRLKKREKKERAKIKRLETRAEAKLEKRVQSDPAEWKPQPKPVFNQEGEMVFSKFDFSALGAKDGKQRRKIIRDPKVALRKSREEEKRLQDLENKGEKDKALKIKESKAWKNAMLKAEGVRVKDDPELLKKTIKKVKKRKEKSKAKWTSNLKKVEKEKEEKQRKRTENLQARSRDKKLKKLKTQAKRGRLIAGF